MGLTLVVGLLAMVEEDEDPQRRHIRRVFKAVSGAVKRTAQTPWREPTELPEDDQYEGDMPGYSGLHALRRIAARTAYGLPIDQLGRRPTEDPAVTRWYAAFDRGEPVEFEHLMVHGDSEASTSRATWRTSSTRAGS